MSLGGSVGGQTRHELEHRLVKDGQLHRVGEREKKWMRTLQDTPGQTHTYTHTNTVLAIPLKCFELGSITCCLCTVKIAVKNYSNTSKLSRTLVATFTFARQRWQRGVCVIFASDFSANLWIIRLINRERARAAKKIALSAVRVAVGCRCAYVTHSASKLVRKLAHIGPTGRQHEEPQRESEREGKRAHKGVADVDDDDENWAAAFNNWVNKQ